MKPTPIEEARRALALASNAVIDACKSETNDPDISGVNLLTSVHRLLRTVQNNVHLDRARADSMAEYRRDNAPILAKKVRAIRDLRALRDDAQATFPVLDESRRVTATSSDDTLAKFDAMVRDVLKKGGDIDEGDVSDPNAGSGAMEILERL